MFGSGLEDSIFTYNDSLTNPAFEYDVEGGGPRWDKIKGWD